MAGRGKVPKDPANRARNNAEVRTKIEAGSNVIPLKFPGRRTEDKRVTKWWDAFADSPMSQMYEATDWQRLEALVPMVRAYWTAIDEDQFGSALLLMKELRLQESLLGALAADRMRLRWDVERPSRPTSEVVQAGARFRGRVVSDPNASGQ